MFTSLLKSLAVLNIDFTGSTTSALIDKIMLLIWLKAVIQSNQHLYLVFCFLLTTEYVFYRTCTYLNIAEIQILSKEFFFKNAFWTVI